MENQYGNYGVCKHKNGRTDSKAFQNYVSRLQFAKRVQVLKNHVQVTDHANHFTVSEDGAHVLDKQGKIVD